MSDTLTALSANLANNLVSLREKRGMTQNSLAKLSGVPRSTVANLESGDGNPSLANLAKISGALQVSLEELIARPRASCKLLKAREISPRRRAGKATAIYRLLPDPIPGMEIERMELGPGDRFGGVPHTSGTKEYLICVAGQITCAVAGEKYALSEGDVLAFPGDQAHSYQNPGARECVCISVVALAPAGL
jgi:transcriptional regulator with XRE-family HTH domain